MLENKKLTIFIAGKEFNLDNVPFQEFYYYYVPLNNFSAIKFHIRIIIEAVSVSQVSL